MSCFWVFCKADCCVIYESLLDVGRWLTCAEVPMSDIQARSRLWRSTRYFENAQISKSQTNPCSSQIIEFVPPVFISECFTHVRESCAQICKNVNNPLFSFHSAIRTLQPTGRAAPTWRLYRGSMGFLSQTQRCWRSGNVFRRRPRTETIARLAKWVTVGSHVQAHPAAWSLELKASNKGIFIHNSKMWWLSNLLFEEFSCESL